MTMVPSYITAAKTVGWLLTDLETALEQTPANSLVDHASILKACSSRVPTADEVLLAVNGLVGLGVLRPAGRAYAFDASVFAGTREYRRGFMDGMTAVAQTSDVPTLSLCVAVPPSLAKAFARGMGDTAADLRAAIVNVIAAATNRLVLASPFWDVATASEIGELARRRVDAGVKLDILGRSDATDDAMSHLNRLFARRAGVRVFRWYDPTPEKEIVSTFHFKAVVADDGARTYVGTANLTRSSLRSRMELGFIVGGSQGTAVARIVDAVISISERIGP